MAIRMCPRCGSGGVVSIDLSLGGGERVALHSCNACEGRWWRRDGASIELTSVLELASRKKAAS